MRIGWSIRGTLWHTCRRATRHPTRAATPKKVGRVCSFFPAAQWLCDQPRRVRVTDEILRGCPGLLFWAFHHGSEVWYNKGMPKWDSSASGSFKVSSYLVLLRQPPPMLLSRCCGLSFSLAAYVVDGFALLVSTSCNRFSLNIPTLPVVVCVL